MSENLTQDDPSRQLLGRALGEGQGALQVRTGYATAIHVQKPRDLKKVKVGLLEEATLAGDAFFYGWGAGKDHVEGPSVNLALSAVRLWGNCVVEMKPLQELEDSWLYTAAFVDLETGFTLERQFRQAKKWTVHGKFDVHRKDDIRFQIGQSKAIRNVVLNALPSWLIDAAVERAKEGAAARLEAYIRENGLAAATESILAALAKEGVKLEAVLAKFDREKREDLEKDDLLVMRADVAAIRAGSAYASELYSLPGDSAPTTEDLKPGAPPPDRDALDVRYAVQWIPDEGEPELVGEPHREELDAIQTAQEAIGTNAQAGKSIDGAVFVERRDPKGKPEIVWRTAPPATLQTLAAHPAQKQLTKLLEARGLRFVEQLSDKAAEEVLRELPGEQPDPEPEWRLMIDDGKSVETVEKGTEAECRKALEAAAQKQVKGELSGRLSLECHMGNLASIDWEQASTAKIMAVQEQATKGGKMKDAQALAKKHGGSLYLAPAAEVENLLESWRKGEPNGALFK